ncbi:hypothetical protein FOA52_015931 [Chlamydomonas sp. UWO 241]|nr:hypothetical protein FOA52_015931 [Chlamydomonas sp. UWO 241]
MVKGKGPSRYAKKSGDAISIPGPKAATTKLITAKTRRGRRIQEARAPKAVEDTKKSLVLYGNKISQVLKDVLTDFHKIKKTESVKYTRRNENVRPFEAGGETSLEFYCRKGVCGLFALGAHSKKRPHNLTLGRMYDGHLYDAVELGVEEFQSISSFGNKATGAYIGNKPALLFVGEKFESVVALKQLRSTLLDYFRGEQVSQINLAGFDRVIVVTALSETSVLLRQYVIKMKKSGTKLPRIELEEMGPRLDFSVRRHRVPPPDVQKEACIVAKVGKKTEKNVEYDMLDGRVGRIYMPAQKVDTIALSKPKGTKRDRHAATNERKAKAQAAGTASGGRGGPDGPGEKKGPKAGGAAKKAARGKGAAAGRLGGDPKGRAPKKSKMMRAAEDV